MHDLKDKVAVITGAGSGLGRELVLACARRGMRIAGADVDEPGLAETQRLLLAEHPSSVFFSQKLDVSKLENVQAFADAVFTRFGAAHAVFNNAGVAISGPVWQNSEKDWNWVLGVNLMGVAWGIKAFVPRMIAQGEGHIVNTASAAGWAYMPELGIYNVSKSGVVAMSETLLADLRSAGSKLGVTVLCPAFFRTGISNASRNRPAELTDAVSKPVVESEAARIAREKRRAWVDQAIDTSPVNAKDIAELTLEAIEVDRFYVFPHPQIKELIKLRAHNATSDGEPTAGS
ncbi:MAG TPA: SDR family NAD(P)-dependent oxidoreductase [Polyangiales bacterium]|nr:SDR family NAD(P)-dependent oxidoreductase [Polyangiales bacterium]